MTSRPEIVHFASPTVTAADGAGNIAPLRGLEKQMAKRGRPPGVKNGEGKTSKANAERKASASGGKRGRKPKAFLLKLGAIGDSVEGGLKELSEFLMAGMSQENRPEFQVGFSKAIGSVDHALKALGEAVAVFAGMPEGYVPGFVAPVVLAWEQGALAEVTNDVIRASLGEAGEAVYEVESLLELGKGPGNGTMVKLKGLGVFNQKHLSLVDPAQVEPENAPAPTRDFTPLGSVEMKVGAVMKPIAAPKASAPNGEGSISRPTEIERLAALAKADALKAMATDEDLNA